MEQMSRFNPPVVECISVSEAAEYAGSSRSVLFAALQSRKLQGIKRAGRWLTTREAVDAYFREQQEDWLNKQDRIERGMKIRARWTCRRCGCKDGQGMRHIKIYYKDRDESNQVEENMIVVCYECWLFAMRHYHPQQMLLPGMELPEWIR
jgi:hypothetical protein